MSLRIQQKLEYKTSGNKLKFNDFENDTFKRILIKSNFSTQEQFFFLLKIQVGNATIKSDLEAYKYHFEENAMDNGEKDERNKCFCREGKFIIFAFIYSFDHSFNWGFIRNICFEKGH